MDNMASLLLDPKSSIQYFAGDPPCQDKMWIQEVSSVWQYCQDGRGLDMGAGMRTLTPKTLRVDSNPATSPDFVADIANPELPFGPDFDFVYSSHALEHLADPLRAISAWCRYIRPGGHLVLILPNTTYTKGMNTDPTPHRFEWDPRDFLELFGYKKIYEPWFEARFQMGALNLISFDEAQPRWSFHAVFQRGD